MCRGLSSRVQTRGDAATVRRPAPSAPFRQLACRDMLPGWQQCVHVLAANNPVAGDKSVTSSSRSFPRPRSMCFHVTGQFCSRRPCPPSTHPAMLAPVQPTLPWLRISLRSQAQSSRRASCADPKRRARAEQRPGASPVAAGARPATCASTETAACEQRERACTNGFERHGRRSLRRSITPAASAS